MTLLLPDPAHDATAASPDALLSVRDLRVATVHGTELVHGVSLDLRAGRSVGLVGESGSGKTLTSMAVAGLLPRGVEATAGSIVVAGQEVLTRDAATRRRLLRDSFGVVFQNPTVSLNPRLTIGRQLREALPAEVRRDRARARRRSLELLDHVGVPRAVDRLNAYPHELSGGLNQRVVIAIAIARSPRILIADEATTALDVSVQKQVLDLVDELRRELDLGLVVVSHDVGLVAERADDVLVLRDGRTVEQGPVGTVLEAPAHAYTRELLASVPRLDNVASAAPADGEVILEARDLVREFPVPGRGQRPVRAVDHVDLRLHEGQSLGVVGESGSGKTTLARILVGLDHGWSGQVRAFGGPVEGRTVAARRRRLREVQLVFQDPYSSLDPRQSVAQIVAEPIELSGLPEQKARKTRTVAELLDAVRLPRALADRTPRELSGGQRQRVGIARALALDPRVVIADEPVSALDLSVQATILELLATLRAERNLSYLVISHDLAVIKELCTDVVVMQEGRVVERGPTEELFTDPRDAYTRLLLEAIPGRQWRHGTTHPIPTAQRP